MKINTRILLFWDIFIGLFVGGCSGVVSTTPVIQTVVQTVPVEVTRMVETTRILEITRQVIVTQMVEVPVTVTPSTQVETGTALPHTVGPTQVAVATPRITPQEKYAGYTPIFVQNRTKDKLDVYLSGPDEFNLVLWGGNEQKIWVREGNYSYIIWENGQEAYRGAFKIVSADKYDLFLDETKAILWAP